jgi:hypothetical protein
MAFVAEDGGGGGLGRAVFFTCNCSMVHYNVKNIGEQE